MPALETVVTELIQAATGARQLLSLESDRFLVLKDGSWEYRCPIKMFGSLLKLKLEGFRQDWGAQAFRTEGMSHHYRVPTQPLKELQASPRPMRERLARVEVRLQFVTGQGHGVTAQVSEVIVRICPYCGDTASVRDAAPRIFQSLRNYLQTGAENRTEDRYTFSQSLHVYPILPELELAGVLEAKGRNVSLGGMQFIVSERPTTDFFYLHFRETPKLSQLAILARAVRAQPDAAGHFEIGVSFAAETSLR